MAGRMKISLLGGKAARFAGLFAILLASGCCGDSGAGRVFPTKVIDFDSTQDGSLPADFSTALTGGGGPVSWAVRDDASLGVGHKALVQESSDDTSYRFPMCIYEKFSGRDEAVEVKYKAISGKVDEAGGIVLRYSPENYYIARANVLEDNVDLFKTVKGKRTLVEEAPVKVAANAWHTLRFEAKGPRLKIVFDGEIMIDTVDTTFGRAGRVGLWTKADSVSAFTGFKIEPAP